MILGIHHVTAITSDGQKSIDFYAGLLGLRVVKVTVNFDDPGSYHLYFGDASGSPGSIVTFFVWPGAHRGRVGNGQVVATTFAVPSGSLVYWMDRLQHASVVTTSSTRLGKNVLRFADFDGLILELIESGDTRHPWSKGGVDEAHAIRGIDGVTLGVEASEHTARLLTETLALKASDVESNRSRFETAGSNGNRIDVLCQPGASHGSMGAGVVHHVAIRVADDPTELRWRHTLTSEGYNVSPVMDRTYFHSIYFREKGGVLFEIATDQPGMSVDEPSESIGTLLRLPPGVEKFRAELKGHLPQLKLPGGEVIP